MIAVVVPTIRPEKFKHFLELWTPLFKKHFVTLYEVIDGEHPILRCRRWVKDYPEYATGEQFTDPMTVGEVMGDYADLIYNFNDGVRNLGVAQAYKDGADYILSLDDDTEPFGDTIQDHLDALNNDYPVSWLNTANEVYMRGFPYEIRGEAEAVLSHGTWKGVADFDASTQLLLGTPNLTYRKMPVPKGILFPICIMNVMWKRKLTPYYYQAPMYGDINRFADIWSGIEVKKTIDRNGWAALTGYAQVIHNRASNPYTNLVKEARGIGMNEQYGKDEYFTLYWSNLERWKQFLYEVHNRQA